ncbi:murein L,D-transpeptidase [Salinarimonas sp.]|uniref:L,D-transpeptidase family protein n=1 Tax=Salinarimonas sp. TaxID=2766526 RepID=UPI00391BFC18
MSRSSPPNRALRIVRSGPAAVGLVLLAVLPGAASVRGETGPGEGAAILAAIDEAGSALAAPRRSEAPGLAPSRREDPAPVPAPSPAPALPAPPLLGAIEGLVPTTLAGRLAGAPPLALRRGAEDVAEIAAFYAARGHGPVFVDAAGPRPGPSALARTLMPVLEAAAQEGLDPAAYAVPDIARIAPGDVGAVADAELAFAAAIVRYAQDARGGRIPKPERLHPMITPALDLPGASDVLAGLVAADDPARALADHHPPHEGYRALRAALAELRARGPAEPLVAVPPGPTLRVGMSDPRVPLLRARFGLGDDPPERERLYDTRLAALVEDFQRAHGLAADGVVGAQTIAALASVDPLRREAELVSNMERWRWLPRELGARMVFVNVPAFEMEVHADGVRVETARVIVGKPDAQTPIFSDRMRYLVVNPSWTVPPSILRRDWLPLLRANPDAAAERGFEVIRRGNTISVRQPPGPTNALGLIKFMFPNGHHVYLHDTPNRSLFNTLRRAHSAGCVRVENPFRLAEFLLSPQGWTEERLRGLVGRGERAIHLEDPVPVHLAYFTLSPDGAGGLRVHEDVYGFDALVRDALGLGS